MTFIDIGTVWVIAEMKEKSLAHVRADDRAELVLDSSPGSIFPAKVQSVGWGVSVGPAATRIDSRYLPRRTIGCAHRSVSGDLDHREQVCRLGRFALAPWRHVVIYTGDHRS